MYVQSRKMVQMILFAKLKQRHRCREQIYGYQEEGEEREELGGGDGHVYTNDTVKCLRGTSCMAQRTLLHALW